MHDVLASLGPSKVLSRQPGTVEVEVEIPERGIGDHMAGVLRVVAGGTVELATPAVGTAHRLATRDRVARMKILAALPAALVLLVLAASPASAPRWLRTRLR